MREYLLEILKEIIDKEVKKRFLAILFILVSLNVFSQVNITTELKTDTIRSWSIDKRKQHVYAVCDSMTIDFKYYGRKPRLRKGMAVSIEAVGYKVRRLKLK